MFFVPQEAMVPVRLPKSFLQAMKETILKDNKLIPDVHKDLKPTDLSSGSHKKEAAFTTDDQPGNVNVIIGGKTLKTQNKEVIEENALRNDVASFVKVDSKSDEILLKLEDKVIKGHQVGSKVNEGIGEACEIAEGNDIVTGDKQKETSLIEVKVTEGSGKGSSAKFDNELEKKQLFSLDAKESFKRKSSEVGSAENVEEKIDSKKVSKGQSTEESRTVEKLEENDHQMQSDVKIVDSNVMKGTHDKQSLNTDLPEKNPISSKALEKPNLSAEINVYESPLEGNLRTDGKVDTEQNQKGNQIEQNEDVENHSKVTGFKETKDFERDCKHDEAFIESNASKMALEETNKSNLNVAETTDKVLARDSIDGNFYLFDNKARKAVVTPKRLELTEIVKAAMEGRQIGEGIDGSIPESPILSPVEESTGKRASKNDSNDSKISEATNSKESSSKKRVRSGSGQHSSRTQSLLKGFFEALDRRKKEQGESKQSGNAGKDSRSGTGVLRKKSVGSVGVLGDKETSVGVIESKEGQTNERKEVLSSLITTSNDIAEIKVEGSNETLASKRSSVLFDQNQDAVEVTAKTSENDLLENERLVAGETRDTLFIEGEGKEDDVIKRSKEKVFVKNDEGSQEYTKSVNLPDIKPNEIPGSELFQENEIKQTRHDVERLAVDSKVSIGPSRLRNETEFSVDAPKPTESKRGDHETVDDNNEMSPFDSAQETKGLDDTLAKRIDRIFTMENVQVDVKTSDSYVPFVIGSCESLRKAKLVRDAPSRVMHSENEPENMQSMPSGMVVKITLTRTNDTEKINEVVSNEDQKNTEITGSKSGEDHTVENTKLKTVDTDRRDVYDAMAGLDCRVNKRDLHLIEGDCRTKDVMQGVTILKTKDDNVDTDRPDVYDAIAGLDSRVNKIDLHCIEGDCKTEDNLQGATNLKKLQERFSSHVVDRTSNSLQMGSNLTAGAEKVDLKQVDSLTGDEHTFLKDDRLSPKSSEVQTKAERLNIAKPTNENIINEASASKYPSRNSELDNLQSKSQSSSSKDDQGVSASNKESQTASGIGKLVIGTKSENADDLKSAVDGSSDVPLKIDERLEAVKKFSLASKLVSGSKTGKVATNTIERGNHSKQEQDIVPRPPRGRARGRPVSGR